ncbi:MAG: malto-oligosyltrehalose synthase [Desulfobacteraceae bacterium]|nr:MAG: malto-oligosyltrehalose synthase [Desulfobacteraceae bacterium]
MTHIPTATYRVQLSSSFDLGGARSIVPYLAGLGVSDLYASPVSEARPGSTHGYDVTDHAVVNSQIGGREEYRSLSRRLRRYRMGLLQDIVTNHMAFDRRNRLLMDVLENGPRSRYYRFFDVAWEHPYEHLRGRILAPFLGKFYGKALLDGELRLEYDQEGLAVRYYEQRYPLSLRSYRKVFLRNMKRAEERLGRNSAEIVRFLGAIHLIETMGKGSGTAGEEDVRHAKAMLRTLYLGNDAIRKSMDDAVAYYNRPDPRPRDALDALLSDQAFRLSFWKVASEEINYRRFFTINDLICVRTELPEVFEYVHRAVFAAAKEGAVTGLRIDHIDGLYDPARYLKRLRREAPEAYIVVEKILEGGEALPPWPVQGTTGYDFMACVNGLFVQERNERAFTRIYQRFTGAGESYEDIRAAKKRLIVGKHLAGNVDNLAQLLKRIADRDRLGRDITLYGLKRALVEVMVHFPVYRTYVNDSEFSVRDRELLRSAVAIARTRFPDLDYELDFIGRYLLQPAAEDPTRAEGETGEHTGPLRFVMELQQLTGPLMAKGCEDTAFYVYNRLISLNEVGGSPDRFGCTIPEFHRFNINRLRSWPHTLNATATHDSKRGEDARTRIDVLSEMPEEWERALRRFSSVNHRLTSRQRGSPILDRNDEYLFYQSLIGSFPFDEQELPSLRRRMREYSVKAVREAKVHTAWIKPDTQYEEGCTAFIDAILDEDKGREFLDQLRPLVRRVAFYGMLNSLSQILLKITSPGVPDFYQGTELWELSLVDPDNRRPVDYTKRAALLSIIRGDIGLRRREFIEDVLRDMETGEVKLLLTYLALQARRAHAALFTHGEYIPIETGGNHADHVVCFMRRLENSWALVAVPRLLTSVTSEGVLPLGRTCWGDTAVVLPSGVPEAWDDAVGGGVRRFEGSAAGRRVAVGDLFDAFPVSLLTSRKRTP